MGVADREARCCAVTLTVADAAGSVPTVAVMVALPPPAAVTRPVPSTVAAATLECQVTRLLPTLWCEPSE